MPRESEGGGQERFRHPEPYLTAMRTEEIERYLTRQMAGEEREAFEREMQEQPQLREDVKIVAWTIEAIRERGQQEDAESIRRMREQMGSDNKRYKATVAAVIGGVLVVAAMTAVSIPPIYNHVIKPVIESVIGSDKQRQTSPQQPTSTVSTDSLANNTSSDSMDVDSLAIQGDETLPEEPQQTDETPTEEEKPEQQTVNEEPTKEEPAKPAVEEENREPEDNTIDKQINITGQNWMDENGTKYNPYSLVCNKGELILHVSLVNNNEDRDIEITDVRLLDESGNMHNPTKVTINSKSNKYHLRRTEKAELEIHFKIGTKPQKIQYISFKDRSSTQKVLVRNMVIN